MKENGILKLISCLLIPVLIVMLVVSIFTINLENHAYYNEEKYFNSSNFVSRYTDYLKMGIYELIHNNDYYDSIQDGNIEIHYMYEQDNYFTNIKNGYYLIIYKDKALTNIELTGYTNTIESIKKHIKESENAKQVDIIYGEIQSESEIIQRLGFQHVDRLTEPYYTLQYDSNNMENQFIEYITAVPEDFEIYSSFVEEFGENSEQEVVKSLMDKFSPIQEYAYFIIPASSILIILILVYLVIATGYKKGVEGIAINDFDKIPLEIILIAAIIIGIIPVIILDEMYNDNYKAIISLIATTWLVIYILCIMCLNTIIKRIKSKMLLKSSIIGKILLFIADCLEKIYNKYKFAYNTITYSTSVSMKVLLYFGIIIPTAIAIWIAFQDSFTTIVLELILMVIVAYRIIKTAKGYTQIESKLKEMYEGNNKNALKKENFGKEFHSTVRYINDISSGFENAIQDRIKSERLKAELITNVSHDIKTPLTSIINYVDLLKQEDIQNEKAQEYIGILDNKSQRLKKLTEDLVEASKVSTGNISLKLEKINIVELIKQAEGEFEDKFKMRGLDAIIDNKETEIYIKADSRYMYRIIENLFSNISKYALDNSRVYIDIKKLQKSVIIEMKNISKEKLNISADELIQRFVRGEKSRTTEGSGLGISIAQNLTELQNGKFTLKLDGDLFKVELEFEIM